MKGFKDFIMRGNLVDMAVAFIMGTAFATVVTTFTSVVMSLIAKVLGGHEPNFDNWQPGGIPLGPFLTALVAFLLLSVVVYFGIVKPINALRNMSKKEEDQEEESEAALLGQIRDLLAAGNPDAAKRLADGGSAENA